MIGVSNSITWTGISFCVSKRLEKKPIIDSTDTVAIIFIINLLCFSAVNITSMTTFITKKVNVTQMIQCLEISLVEEGVGK